MSCGVPPASVTRWCHVAMSWAHNENTQERPSYASGAWHHWWSRCRHRVLPTAWMSTVWNVWNVRGPSFKKPFFLRVDPKTSMDCPEKFCMQSWLALLQLDQLFVKLNLLERLSNPTKNNVISLVTVDCALNCSELSLLTINSQQPHKENQSILDLKWSMKAKFKIFYNVLASWWVIVQCPFREEHLAVCQNILLCIWHLGQDVPSHPPPFLEISATAEGTDFI